MFIQNENVKKTVLETVKARINPELNPEALDRFTKLIEDQYTLYTDDFDYFDSAIAGFEKTLSSKLLIFCPSILRRLVSQGKITTDNVVEAFFIPEMIDTIYEDITFVRDPNERDFLITGMSEAWGISPQMIANRAHFIRTGKSPASIIPATMPFLRKVDEVLYQLDFDVFLKENKLVRKNNDEWQELDRFSLAAEINNVIIFLDNDGNQIPASMDFVAHILGMNAASLKMCLLDVENIEEDEVEGDDDATATVHIFEQQANAAAQSVH